MNITRTLKSTLEHLILMENFYYVAKVVLMASLYSLIIAIVCTCSLSLSLPRCSSSSTFIMKMSFRLIALRSLFLYYIISAISTPHTFAAFFFFHTLVFKAFSHVHTRGTHSMRCAQPPYAREVFIPLLGTILWWHSWHTFISPGMSFVSFFSRAATSLSYFNYLITHMFD